MEYETKTILTVRPEVLAEVDALMADPQTMARVNAVIRFGVLIGQARIYGYSLRAAREWALGQLSDAERVLLAHAAELPDRPLLESEG